MNTESVVRWIAIALIALGLVGGEAAVWFSSDGVLSPGTLARLRVGQAVLVAVGLGALLVQGRLRRAIATERGALAVLTWAGIVLRVAVFALLAPRNNDPHFGYVHYILAHGALPAADAFVLAFQPPLYYLLAAPLAWLGGAPGPVDDPTAGAKAAQMLSLLLSVANLLLLRHLIATTPLLRTTRGRAHALAFAAFLPQFVVFGSFVSNDALAYPLGTLVFFAAARCLDRPGARSLLALGGSVGLGLLTKGTFIACLPALAAGIVAAGLRRRDGLWRIAAALALFGAAAAVVGCYKYVENTVHFGTPVVGNDILKQDWLQRQQGTVRGVESFVDVDLIKLVRHPLEGEATQHSIPLLMYATFWYSYIRESNLNATRGPPLLAVPRLLYVLGAPATLLLLLGVGLWLVRSRAPQVLRHAPDAEFRVWWHGAIAFLLLAGNTAIVLVWGVQHDAWSFFQARLVFPMFFALAAALGAGCEATAPWRRSVDLTLLALYGVIAAYFALELGSVAATWIG